MAKSTYHILRDKHYDRVVGIVKHVNNETLFFKRVTLAIADYFDVPVENVTIFTNKSSSMFDFSVDVKQKDGKITHLFNLTETKIY